MYFYITIVELLYFVSDFGVFSESTKDANGVELKATTKIPYDYVSTQDSWEINPSLKSLWVYRPPTVQQSHQSDEQQSQHIVLKPPHLVTRLAKPLSFGFDPFFNKAFFEPFERRQKPVTLVTFRKNGFQPRKMADPHSEVSAEVAELQSAFNDISSLWHDAPEIINI